MSTIRILGGELADSDQGEALSCIEVHTAEGAQGFPLGSRSR